MSFDGLEDQKNILFKTLGLDVMSEDEPDGVGSLGEKRYRIIESDWRDPRLVAWLRLFDGLYISTRFNEVGLPTPGSWPRIRIPPGPNAPKAHRRPPSGLPRNFFNPKYLAGLQPYQLAQLQLKEPVTLTFPKDLVQYVNHSRFIHSKPSSFAIL